MAALFRAILQPRAIAFLDACSDDEVREIRRLVEHICLDPWINETTKITLHWAPIVFTVLIQGGFWIVYHFHDRETISIVNIQRDEDGSRPSPR